MTPFFAKYFNFNFDFNFGFQLLTWNHMFNLNFQLWDQLQLSNFSILSWTCWGTCTSCSLKVEIPWHALKIVYLEVEVEQVNVHTSNQNGSIKSQNIWWKITSYMSFVGRAQWHGSAIPCLSKVALNVRAIQLRPCSSSNNSFTSIAIALLPIISIASRNVGR